LGPLGRSYGAKPSLDPDKLIALIAASPEGLGMEALEAAFPATPRRNLQRLAATLVAQGRLHASGGGRARRYRVAADAAPTLQRTLADDSGIPLTSEAAGVRALGGQRALFLHRAPPSPDATDHARWAPLFHRQAGPA